MRGCKRSPHSQLREKKLKGYTSEGVARNLTVQVCEVNKALLSARKVVQVGNRVVFDAEGSLIEDKSTGQKMWLKGRTACTRCARGSVARAFSGRAS